MLFAQTNFTAFICHATRLYFIEIMLTKFANKGRIMYLCRQLDFSPHKCAVQPTYAGCIVYIRGLYSPQMCAQEKLLIPVDYPGYNCRLSYCKTIIKTPFKRRF